MEIAAYQNLPIRLHRDGGYNFIRLWTPENARDFDPPDEMHNDYYAVGSAVGPTLYKRLTEEECDAAIAAGQTCTARDGLRKFNLSHLNQAYFDQLKDRIEAAKAKNIYVSIMLFNGWGVGIYYYLTQTHNTSRPWWLGHPYNVQNNFKDAINFNKVTCGDSDGMHSGLGCHTLNFADALSYERAYVLKVIDTVKYFDNVLFEISNESAGRNHGYTDTPSADSTTWQREMIDFIHDTEADIEGSNNNPTPTYRHPVGMTFQWGGINDDLRSSHADWIAVGSEYQIIPDPGDSSYELNPDQTDGNQVVILDTDHLRNNTSDTDAADHSWVWKAFTRGYNPIYMDRLDQDPANFGGAFPPGQISPTAQEVREAMGDTRAYANTMDLVHMTPQARDSDSPSSAHYSLAYVGHEYLIYQPEDQQASYDFTVTLVNGNYTGQWFKPADHTEYGSPFDFSITGGTTVKHFSQPFGGDAVLHLTRNGAR